MPNEFKNFSIMTIFPEKCPSANFNLFFVIELFVTSGHLTIGCLLVRLLC